VARAIEAGGGCAVAAADAATEGAEAIVWLSSSATGELAEALTATPTVRWVQLPFAGVEEMVAAGVVDRRRMWTCAKGSYAEPVAEHALGLALAGLRRLPERIRASSWGSPAGTSLYDRDVTILGGGGITAELLRLLAPYRVRATVVRRRGEPIPGASAVVGTDHLHEALRGALVVFVALALTDQTRGIIDGAALGVMDREAWLVNVARGAHVETAALVDALAGGRIGGAALDVTDPEPLPDGHPLWALPNCIITPHTADTWDMVRPRLAERITTNVARFRTGAPLEGLVDPDAGY
jgi:phosphoglycerate dehydrogenase-like enzyme